MTEDEAKTKWCPMVRIDLYPESREVSCVGNDRGYHDALCKGSGCMMWRGERIYILAYEDTGEWLPLEVTFETADNEIMHEGRKAIRKVCNIGGCGLAGKTWK